MSRKHLKAIMVWVIRDCRDSRKDYQLSASRAEELYKLGELEWDPVNHAYITRRDEKVV